MPSALDYTAVVKSCCGCVSTIQALFTFHYLFTQELLKGMLISGGGEEGALVWSSVWVFFRKGQKWSYGIVWIWTTGRKAKLLV